MSALSYATSLQVVGSVWSPPVLYAAAWTPAIFLGVEAVLQRPSPRRCAGLAGGLGVALLTGWPYGVAIALLGAGLYALLRLAARVAIAAFPAGPVLAQSGMFHPGAWRQPLLSPPAVPGVLGYAAGDAGVAIVRPPGGHARVRPRAGRRHDAPPPGADPTPKTCREMAP